MVILVITDYDNVDGDEKHFGRKAGSDDLGLQSLMIELPWILRVVRFVLRHLQHSVGKPAENYISNCILNYIKLYTKLYKIIY